MTESFASNECGRWRQRFIEYRYLPPILLFSLVLNLWGNRWGAPNSWHPDEVIARAISMVSQRTLNPHYFPYGGLHYYVLAVGAVLPVLVYDRIFDPEPDELHTQACNQWMERQRVRMIQLARAISGLMSTVVVWITFMVGAVLFDKRVGYLAALLLAMSMSFVAIAHFATVDSPANFWYWLSCLFTLLVWKRGDRRWYILAAVSAGLAIGTKIDRLVVLFPLLASHLLRGERVRVRRLLPFALLTLLSYVLVNPALISAPFEFLDGFTRDLYFNFLREAGKTSYTRIVGYAKSGLGLPLFVMALAGLMYALYDLARRRNAERNVWLLATFVPYYLIFGSKFIPQWYVPFFLPPLMILAAYAGIHAATGLPRRNIIAARFVVAATAGYSFLYTVGLVVQFSYDSRYQAAAWIEQHIPVNATIEMFKRARGPVISSERYRIIESLPDKEGHEWAMTTRGNLARHQPYQNLRQAILDLEQWTGRRLGLPVRKQPFIAWFDSLASSYEKPSDETPGFVGVRTRRPDYVILIEHHQRKRWSTLRSPIAGYRLVAEFRFTNSFGIQPSFSFVNPQVYIFQYWESQSHPPSKSQSDLKAEV